MPNDPTDMTPDKEYDCLDIFDGESLINLQQEVEALVRKHRFDAHIEIKTSYRTIEPTKEFPRRHMRFAVRVR